jgi:NADH:ubiquinone oxidoreductase subunit F (NADH-binding)
MSALAVRDTQLVATLGTDPGLSPGSRLLSGNRSHEPLPLLSSAGARERLLAEIEASGLTGRGGAGFPTATKLRAVARGRAPVVVANGTEGEPASSKDKALLAADPHLVIDGAVTAARLVGAEEVFLAAGRADGRGLAALERAVAERRGRDGSIALRVTAAPDRFVAGEESALVNFLNGGPAKPTVDRPFERGVHGRPTLVQNVETLANVALIARHGAEWFRRLGTAQEPGSALVTVLGAVRVAGVGEIELGITLREMLTGFGGMTAMPQAFLVGGYFGTWVAARDAVDLPFTNESLRPLGASLGARTLIVLPQDACGLAETARVVRYLARESAGQCGSCFFGLPAIATAFETLASGGADAPKALERLARLVPQVEGRGACAHPTGATRLVASALRVFAQEIDRHRAGRCCGPHHPHVLPVPDTDHEWS